MLNPPSKTVTKEEVNPTQNENSIGHRADNSSDHKSCTIANPTIDEVRGYPDENPRDYGNDKGVEIPVRNKGTKELAGWCYNQGIHGETKESHEES